MKTRALILLSLASLPFAPAYAEDEVRFGRLFTEPGTREQLDESRKQSSSAQPLPEAEDVEDAAITTLKVDGVLMRRDGSTEVWVNGVRDDSQLKVQRAGRDRFRVSVPGGGEVILKPGQIYSFESRRVLEGYEADKELASEPATASQAAATQQPAQSSVIVKTAPPMKAPEAKAATPPATHRADPAAEFDETELVEQDFRIKLLEERMEKLEQDKSDQ